MCIRRFYIYIYINVQNSGYKLRLCSEIKLDLNSNFTPYYLALWIRKLTSLCLSFLLIKLTARTIS